MRISKKQFIVGSFIFMLIAGIGSFAYASFRTTDAALADVASSGSVVDLLSPENLAGEETGVVTILIAGNSVDDTNHSGAELTDSILVARYVVATKKLSLISIPRDLWVTSNGTAMKINAIYTVGGMDLLQPTVESITGLTVNHRVLISYNAVSKIVDALGGIDVTIASSDARGIYDPMIGFTISNGTHHLDGAQTLLLARSRNDPTYDGRVAYGLPNGDFDRMANQRMIATTILNTVASSTTLTDISTLKALIESLSGAVETNLSVGQLRRLYDISKEVSATNSLSIRGDDQSVLLQNYTSYDGQSALLPTSGVDNYTLITHYIKESL